MGRESRPWQAREGVLSYFGRREGVARRRYRQFVFEGIVLGKRGELGTGKLGTDMGGRKGDGPREGDSRILGRGGFVEEVLAGAERLAWERERLRRKRVEVEGYWILLGRVWGEERRDSWGRSETGDQQGSIGILLCVLKGAGTDGETII
jgi:hypothetical protein